MQVDQVRDSVNCRVDEVRYFVKIVDEVRVDKVMVDQVECSRFQSYEGAFGRIRPILHEGSPDNSLQPDFLDGPEYNIIKIILIQVTDYRNYISSWVHIWASGN